jgi:hypothetical protein
LATVTCVPYNNVQYLGFHINPWNGNPHWFN